VTSPFKEFKDTRSVRGEDKKSNYKSNVNNQPAKLLKLSGHQGFFFPRRQRFNENADVEIRSMREEETVKVR
jgi:hypothetical protein